MRWEKQADPFYGTKAWKQVRKAALARDNYLCRECMREHSVIGCKIRPATMVHHIIPRTVAPERALDIDNLESLCNTCHERMHPERRQQDAEAVRPPMRVVKI